MLKRVPGLLWCDQGTCVGPLWEAAVQDTALHASVQAPLPANALGADLLRPRMGPEDWRYMGM